MRCKAERPDQFANTKQIPTKQNLISKCIIFTLHIITMSIRRIVKPQDNRNPHFYVVEVLTVTLILRMGEKHG